MSHNGISRIVKQVILVDADANTVFTGTVGNAKAYMQRHSLRSTSYTQDSTHTAIVEVERKRGLTITR